MIAGNIGSNIAVALDTLRANKLRSGLTILGVVLGVSTVMMMAAIVQGIKEQIVSTIEIAGPTTFYVVKVFSQTPVNPDQLPKWIRVRPDLSDDEARRLEMLPEVAYSGIWGQAQGRLEYKGTRTQNLLIQGADNGFPEIQGGELVAGRWFTRGELVSGAAVAVLEEDAARKVFATENPIDKQVKLGGRPAQVVGLYQKAGNIFEPPGQAIGAIVPYLMLDHQFQLDKTNAVFIPVKPRKGITTAQAQEAVTIALREMRRLRPADRNNFDLITQDQILDTFNKISGVFFLVMIVLSSVGLMVGGIGVMAIMMVSVTNRTREIGVRKAVGATQREILLQFLVEAATLTGIGGMLGILVGLTLGRLVTTFMNIDAGIPVALTVVAVTVSVGIGIVFGMIPARRAARLDPIEALRHE
ncbi:MAG: ABC transporter permease [Gemmatimonadaceae bacterium]|nr:ABC transporter permease [Gemmatimonadaceae bacterium]